MKKITKRQKQQKNIISKAKKLVEWMTKNGWDKAKRCPDPIAATPNFNELLIKLCNACNNNP